MSESVSRFGEDARRLSSLAARVLGWRPDEFWRATPEELASILEANAPPVTDCLDRATLNALIENENRKTP